MLTPISIRYPVAALRRSLATAEVAALFGLADDAPEEFVVADAPTLDVAPTDVVLITGPSGSGKSSILRAIGAQLNAVDVAEIPLPAGAVIDLLPGPVPDRLALLSACGLAEPRLMLRDATELSDGQRVRARVAVALASRPGFPLLLDEFGAVLDRPLAKVLAFNLRKLATRTGTGILAATTHDDLAADLAPDVTVQCRGDGRIDVVRIVSEAQKKSVSFADELWVSDGTKSDWPHFARWHYRGHGLGFVKKVVVLWHGEEPVGVCVFAAPAASLALRSQYFGLSNPRGEAQLAALNAKVWVLQRVVLHPTYRGAGVAAAFVRRACELCPVRWIEALSVLGQVNPFFERAGFVRVGRIAKKPGGSRAGAYGGKKHSRIEAPFGNPVYYIRANPT